ncbi:MAG TPA: hypothetical protein VLN59_10500, partial [Burkholderiales bacterium]|nr:hypothetical protein [Burkholderiales bacterium]
ALYGAWAKDSTHTMEQGERLIAVLAYADSLNPSDAAKFLQGATKLTMGQTLLNSAAGTARGIKTASAADKEKACSDSKRAQDLLVEAGPQIQAGGRAFPQQAGQLLEAQMKLTPYADQVGKVVCAKK